MKIVTLSDIHTMWELLEVPDGDVLVVAGDMTGTGTFDQLFRFNEWVGTLPHKHKLVVAGNHDWGFELGLLDSFPDLTSNYTYLQDAECTIDDVVFYGSPWQPAFCNWAFNLPRGEELAEKWDKIPDYTDVLITHGPPYGVLDSNIAPDDTRVNFGCRDLKDAVVRRVKPKYHIFGHIHGSYGKKELHGVTFVNTSICTEAYKPLNKPWVLEIDSDKHNKVLP